MMLICVFSVCSAICFTAGNEKTWAETSGSYTYQVLENGKAEITGYNGSETSIAIPETIDGKTVASIGEWAFKGCSSQSIIIPNSVTNIGRYAFYECSSLGSITIPDSVTDIGAGVFSGTKWLEDLLKISPLVIVNDILIAAESSLESVIIPGNVKCIGGNAFKGCSSLVGIEIPNSVKSIEANAFWDCSSLNSITIPNSVTNIGATAFYRCTSTSSNK